MVVAQLVESSRFQHQRYAVRILTSAKNVSTNRTIEKTKIKKKRPGMAHLKKVIEWKVKPNIFTISYIHHCYKGAPLAQLQP